MIWLIRGFLRDAFSWGLLALLGITVTYGIGSLFTRYEEFDQLQTRFNRLGFEIGLLNYELAQKEMWILRLESDPTAWEQVAREKMNYLGPGEILVTFRPDFGLIVE